MNDAPIPDYSSRRLVGLELEFDAGSTKFNEPERCPDGWAAKYDGSLSNGREYVLEPAVQLGAAKPLIEAFCRAFDAAHTNTTRRGGFHVHVQSPEFGGASDVEKQNAFNIVKLYTHFQPVIDTLVGKSRHDNHYCRKFNARVTSTEVTRMFCLDSLAATRASAKGARNTMTVNMAMCRCRTKSHRSIEFRQGSPSKQFGCVWGWTVMLVALVDIATDNEFCTRWLNEKPTLQNYVAMMAEHERRVGASNLAKWVEWRHEYMNRPPTEEEILRAVSSIRQAPRGLFHVSRVAELNLPLTVRAMEAAVERGLAVQVRANPLRWVAPYSAWAEHDLAQLIQVLSPPQP